MIEIIFATEEDIHALSVVSNDVLDESWTEEDFKGSMKLPYALCLCAKNVENDDCAGYAILYRGGDVAELVSIAVAKVYQNQQIGSCLMEHLIAYAREHGLENITLEVRESNMAAIALYEKYAFRTLGMRHGFYKNPPENALILGRDFR